MSQKIYTHEDSNSQSSHTIEEKEENIEVLNKNFAPFVQSLVKLFALLGKQISPYILTQSKHSTLKPATALKKAQELGFEGRVTVRPSLQEISPLTLPCILFLKENETCILLKKEKNICTILLPEYGNNEKEVEQEYLEKEYTGYSLFLTRKTKYDHRTHALKFREEKYWFWGVIWHYLPIYKHIFFASILINLIAIASSLFSMNVYDRVIPHNAIETLWGLALGLIIAYSCDFILKVLRAYFVDTAGRNTDVILSSKLISHILNMQYASKPESTGVLVNNIREFENLREFFSSSTLIAFVDLPFLIIFLFLIYYIGNSIVFIPLIAIPIMIITGLILQRYSAKNIEENFKQNMQKNAYLVEMVNGLETIKSCSAENSIQDNWDIVTNISALANSSSRTVNSIITTFSSTLTQIVSLAVIVGGVYLISEKNLTMGGLIACNILVGRAMAPLMQISTMLTRVQQSRITLKSLDMLMKSPLENPLEEINNKIHLETTRGLHITFDKVDFSYPNSTQKALNGLSFSIEQGERVGIIGKMGSGKSSLAKLILGLYPVSAGNLYFNNRESRQLDTRDIRARIGFLPQDVVLFYGSVRENIALNDKNIQDLLIIRAAELAGVNDFIKAHPLGLSAPVGERGMNFSGGQRQAIALARALVHQPQLLILDEPSSNMDTISEEILKKRIKKSLQNSSLLLITHRMSMLDLVDRIILLENGSISLDMPKEEAFKILYNKLNK